MTGFGSRLKEARQKKGWTQKQLGEFIGLGNNAIAALESGQNDPRFHVLTGLARALNVSIDSLAFGRPFEEPVDGKSFDRVHLDRLLDKLTDADFKEFAAIAQIRIDARADTHANATGSD